MELKSKQIEAAHLFLVGESAKNIANSLGVTEQTICNWRKEEKFLAYYNSLRNSLLAEAREQMLSLCPVAVERIKYLMANANSESIQLKAAMLALQMSGMSDPGSNAWVYGFGGNTGSDVKSLKAAADIAKPHVYSKLFS